MASTFKNTKLKLELFTDIDDMLLRLKKALEEEYVT